MKRTLAVAAALGITLGTAGLAMAEPAYGPNAPNYYYEPGSTYYAPTYYNPGYAYDPGYAAPPVTAYPPAVAYPYGYYGYDATHSSGGASRAYSYWGAQKSN